MNVVLRILLGAGLFALGYYFGREAGRGAAIVEQLRASSTSSRLEGRRAGSEVRD